MISWRWIHDTDPTVTVPAETAFNALLGTKSHQQYTVDLRLVNTHEIAAINQQYRQQNQPTDVLSFPLYSSIDEIPTTAAPLGDILICPAMIDSEHLPPDEVIIHGTLHLLGFDHETDATTWQLARQTVITPKNNV